MSNSVSKCVVTLPVSFSDEWKNCIFGKRVVGEETLAASRRSDSAEAAREQPPGRDPALWPRRAHGCVCPLGFHGCSRTLFSGLHRFGVIFLSPKLLFIWKLLLLGIGVTILLNYWRVIFNKYYILLIRYTSQFRAWKLCYFDVIYFLLDLSCGRTIIFFLILEMKRVDYEICYSPLES